MLVALAVVPLAQAGIRPSFSLDYSAWNASDIVVAEVSPDDGVFRVLEVLKGSLRPGDVINVPELRPDRNSLGISAYTTEGATFDSGGRDTPIPRQSAGSRLFLFLARDPIALSSGSLKWKSTDFAGSMKASAVWIEGDRLFCFEQTFNPGPTSLVPCWMYTHHSQHQMSEATLNERVHEVGALRSEFNGTVALSGGAERATKLKAFVLSDLNPARFAALDELKKCGPASEPVLEQMLNDYDYADYKDELIRALAASGGKGAGPMLVLILQEELAFWERTGPTLKKGWWNEDMGPHASLRRHYSDTDATLDALKGIREPAALVPASRLLDLWRLLPQLDDKSGVNELAVKCDRLIQSLSAH